VAADGTEGHGLFTKYLIRHLDAPVKIEEVFKRTRRDVAEASGHKQFPGVYNQLYGDFYFTLPEHVPTAEKYAMAKPQAIAKRAVGETIVFNGVTYKTIKSPYTERIWLDRNLGALRVCQSYNDKLCYGDYFQWGRSADGHEKPNSPRIDEEARRLDVNHGYFIYGESDWAYASSWSDAEDVDEDGSLRYVRWARTDGSSICPKGFRVPTIDELKAETLAQGVKNRDDAFNGFLKLPTSGRRNGYHIGEYEYLGYIGFIWSSSPDGARAQNLYFSPENADTTKMGWDYRANGSAVRCIRGE